MKLHANARTCPNSRRLLVDRILLEKWSVTAAAEAAGVSDRTAYRWLARWRADGQAGLADRCSAPKRIPHRTPTDRVRAIESLRRLRMTAAEIAEILSMALSTVSAVLKRIGLGKRSRLEPPEPPNRYERRRPGELVHLDKGAGRGRGGGKAGGGGGAGRGVPFLVFGGGGGGMGKGFSSRACRALGEGIRRHLFTRPYRPRTNGKAERFIQTLVDRWAYGAIYGSSPERAAALPGWLKHYNFTRPHGSLAKQPPGSRLTNLPGNYN